MPKLWIDTREKADGRRVLRLAGALSGADLELVEAQCTPLLDDPAPVVLDLSRLTYLSCAGARLLNRLASAGARLAAPPALIAEVLEDDRRGG